MVKFNIFPKGPFIYCVITLQSGGGGAIFDCTGRLNIGGWGMRGGSSSGGGKVGWGVRGNGGVLGVGVRGVVTGRGEWECLIYGQFLTSLYMNEPQDFIPNIKPSNQTWRAHMKMQAMHVAVVEWKIESETFIIHLFSTINDAQRRFNFFQLFLTRLWIFSSSW